ncbi:hypothetical protein PtB15_7B527 [Puccinia triticina]|nr:hypothetical protein PtB15_7B527 [Puccinia triticina]
MEKKFSDPQVPSKFIRSTTHATLTPWKTDITGWDLYNFKRGLLAYLNSRNNMLEFMIEAEAGGLLKWVGYIMNNNVYPKSRPITLDTKDAFALFAARAEKVHKSPCHVLVSMANPEKGKKDKATNTKCNNILRMQYGTAEERKQAEHLMWRKEVNPKAVLASNRQTLCMQIRESCLQHPNSAAEGLTFTCQDNPTLYMVIGNNRIWNWTDALERGDAGVNLTHPPEEEDDPIFIWLEKKNNQPRPPRRALRNAATPTSRRGVSSVPPSSSMGGWVSHTSPGTGRHKNPRLESVSPSRCSSACEWCQEPLPLLPVLGVEHLGTLDQYLGICQIGVHDHHTRILLEHYKITHWTYFRRVHPDTLLMLKFAEGPAQQLCDGMALWVATLQKNRREIENEVEYASNR